MYPLCCKGNQMALGTVIIIIDIHIIIILLDFLIICTPLNFQSVWYINNYLRTLVEWTGPNAMQLATAANANNYCAPVSGFLIIRPVCFLS